MKRLLSIVVILCVGFMLLTANMSCNTIAGMGQDIESAGEAIEDGAED